MTTPDQIVGDETVGEMRRDMSRVLSDLARRAKDDRVSDKEAAVVLRAMIAAVPYDVINLTSTWRLMAIQAAR